MFFLLSLSLARLIRVLFLSISPSHQIVSRDEEYEALTKGSNLGSCQGSGDSSFATRVGGTTYLVGWMVSGLRKARLEGIVVD